MNIILLLLLAAVPAPDALRERCNRIEFNHFYDDEAGLVFDQLLFWDWSHDAGRFQLRAWRMVKWQTGKQQAPIAPALPTYNHAKRCWESRWLDGDVTRSIEAGAVLETWTQYDPELTEREFLPKEQRRELLRPSKP